MGPQQRKDAIATILDTAALKCAGPGDRTIEQRMATLRSLPNTDRLGLMLGIAQALYGKDTTDELTADLAFISCGMKDEPVMVERVLSI
jgi:hypothetical protein